MSYINMFKYKKIEKFYYLKILFRIVCLIGWLIKFKNYVRYDYDKLLISIVEIYDK